MQWLQLDLATSYKLTTYKSNAIMSVFLFKFASLQIVHKFILTSKYIYVYYIN